MILDEEIAFPLAEGYQYRPKNFSLKTYGEVSLADALGNSLNIPAVKLVHELGVQTFLDFLLKLRQTFGSATKAEITQDQERFSAKQLGLSVALGTYEMSPLHFAELWRFFFDEKEEELEAYEKGRDEVYSILMKNQHRILSFGVDNYLNQA